MRALDEDTRVFTSSSSPLGQAANYVTVLCTCVSAYKYYNCNKAESPNRMRMYSLYVCMCSTNTGYLKRRDEALAISVDRWF